MKMKIKVSLSLRNIYIEKESSKKKEKKIDWKKVWKKKCYEKD